MDKETIIIIAVIALVLLAVLVATGIISFNIENKSGNTNTGGSSESMPEECKVPAGQDLNSWKEHLGHHENTKYCLDYYK